MQFNLICVRDVIFQSLVERVFLFIRVIQCLVNRDLPYLQKDFLTEIDFCFL